MFVAGFLYQKGTFSIGFVDHKKTPDYHNYLSARKGVFSVPSSSEGLSLAYLEAMGCGARVVGCCKKDMGDLDFMQPPFASLTEFGDEIGLADCITHMLSRKNFNPKNVRARVVEYNLENMYRRIYDVYKSVLNESTSKPT